MRKPDVEVREVVCSETGKPMPKIPLWMADVKVKFVSDEARQKSSPAIAIADVEPIRRVARSDSDEPSLADIPDVLADPDEDLDDLEIDEEEVIDDDL